MEVNSLSTGMDEEGKLRLKLTIGKISTEGMLRGVPEAPSLAELLSDLDNNSIRFCFPKVSSYNRGNLWISLVEVKLSLKLYAVWL